MAGLQNTVTELQSLLDSNKTDELSKGLSKAKVGHHAHHFILKSKLIFLSG
jgi:hypothetical protein